MLSGCHRPSELTITCRQASQPEGSTSGSSRTRGGVQKVRGFSSPARVDSYIRRTCLRCSRANGFVVFEQALEQEGTYSNLCPQAQILGQARRLPSQASTYFSARSWLCSSLCSSSDFWCSNMIVDLQTLFEPFGSPYSSTFSCFGAS